MDSATNILVNAAVTAACGLLVSAAVFAIKRVVLDRIDALHAKVDAAAEKNATDHKEVRSELGAVRERVTAMEVKLDTLPHPWHSTTRTRTQP